MINLDDVRFFSLIFFLAFSKIKRNVDYDESNTGCPRRQFIRFYFDKTKIQIEEANFGKGVFYQGFTQKHKQKR